MIDVGWSRSATGAATVVLGVAVLTQLAALTTLMLPWLLAVSLAMILVEGALATIYAQIRGSAICEPPRPGLSVVLWLSAAATPRPLHALFCVGAVLVLRLMPARTTRVVAASVGVGLGAMAWLDPNPLLASWSAADLAQASVLYRAGCALTALPLVLFAAARGGR